MVWGVRVLEGGSPEIRQLPCFWCDQGVYAVMAGGRFWIRHADDGMPEINAQRPVPLPEPWNKAA